MASPIPSRYFPDRAPARGSGLAGIVSDFQTPGSGSLEGSLVFSVEKAAGA